MIRRLAIVLFVLVGANAFSQDVVIGAPVVSRNCNLTSSISGYPATGRTVSGTNESFTVNATISDADYTPTTAKPKWTKSWISDVKIEIGDETVATWNYKKYKTYVGSKSFTVRWDTTHFTPGNGKVVKITAKMETAVIADEEQPLNGGTTSEPLTGTPSDDATASASLRIYNFGWAGDINEFMNTYNCRQYALQAYTDMNHLSHESKVYNPETAAYEPAVTFDTIDSGLKVSTVFYLHCHGHGSNGQTDWGWTDGATFTFYPTEAMIIPMEGRQVSDVLSRRVWAEQNGYPRMNFAYIDDCWTGLAAANLSNPIAMAFLYPTDDAVQTYFTTNRAYLSWSVKTYSQWKVIFTQHFWQEMADGATANKARRVAYTELYYADQTEPLPEFDYGDDDDQVRLITGLFGDQLCRLHGLYTGTDGYNTAWLEVLE